MDYEDKYDKDNVAVDREKEDDGFQKALNFNAGKDQKKDLKQVQSLAHDVEIKKIVDSVISQYIEK